MKLTSIIAILSVAMAADVQAVPNPAAAPADSPVLKARTDPNCSNTGTDKKVCCTTLAGLVTCVVQVLSNTCTGGQAYCCETNSAVGSLVSITALNCINF